LVKLSLSKTVFQLGDIIKGSFDFSAATVRCFQVSVRLECEESIDSSVCNPIRVKKPSVKLTVGEHHELTHDTLHTSFSFQIPVDGTQEFSTDLVSVQWLLEFQFMTASATAKESQEIHVEPLQWDLPIRVLVPSPPPSAIYKPRSCFTLH